MKHFKICTVLFLLLFACLSTTVFADSTFTFSTEPQSIGSDTLSGPVAIHSDTPVSETTYITLVSTSGTGQFFSSKTSTDPIVAGAYIYISTNTSNRTIYYKDPTAGDFVITANIFAKDKTTQLATLDQHIIVGSQTSGTDSNNTIATTTDTTSDTQTTTDNSSPVISAHSSPAPLSGTENKIEFEISAGRDRLTTVGNKLIFQAVPTKVVNMSGSYIAYSWSFGDGTVALGNNLNHTYKFPGDYSVVVNASYADKQATSRLQVKVISPAVSITRVPGGIEVANNSKMEINLEGWSLVSLKKIFVFPADTLISSGKKITFADETTGIFNETVQLLNPLGQELASINKPVTAETPTVAEEATLNLADIQAKINEVKTAVAKISPVVENNVVVAEPTEEQINSTQIGVVGSSDLPKKSTTGSANTATVFEASPKKGFISTIFSWPIKGFNFIRHLFVEE